jgi:hypothetical protein
VLGCGTTVCSETIGMVRSARVFSNGGLVVMGTVGVTTLHPRGMGKLELPLPFKVVSSSLVDSSRTMCSDGNLL